MADFIQKMTPQDTFTFKNEFSPEKFYGEEQKKQISNLEAEVNKEMVGKNSSKPSKTSIIGEFIDKTNFYLSYSQDTKIKKIDEAYKIAEEKIKKIKEKYVIIKAAKEFFKQNESPLEIFPGYNALLKHINKHYTQKGENGNKIKNNILDNKEKGLKNFTKNGKTKNINTKRTKMMEHFEKIEKAFTDDLKNEIEIYKNSYQTLIDDFKTFLITTKSNVKINEKPIKNNYNETVEYRKKTKKEKNIITGNSNKYDMLNPNPDDIKKNLKTMQKLINELELTYNKLNKQQMIPKDCQNFSEKINECKNAIKETSSLFSKLKGSMKYGSTTNDEYFKDIANFSKLLLETVKKIANELFSDLSNKNIKFHEKFSNEINAYKIYLNATNSQIKYAASKFKNTKEKDYIINTNMGIYQSTLSKQYQTLKDQINIFIKDLQAEVNKSKIDKFTVIWDSITSNITKTGFLWGLGSGLGIGPTIAILVKLFEAYKAFSKSIINDEKIKNAIGELSKLQNNNPLLEQNASSKQ